ncbi:L-amino acid N-acyltransferase YncA [Rhizobium sp. BK512]|uniref:GNAT family N-acetyltransferase n=1 Tax=Rhizobium sp. BK512 TaxID=2587010 RepID=UPI0017DDE0A0|nr:GNAT family N-acetyltransferase [Rhizobium sp. BK512]MBB3564382.1 L-amino acid N-acyltransferase YncA [Rhizobium sp. BK512]
MRRRWESLNEAGFPYVVVRFKERTLGYADVGPYRSRPAYQYAVEDSVYIDPDVTGRGLGRHSWRN